MSLQTCVAAATLAILVPLYLFNLGLGVAGSVVLTQTKDDGLDGGHDLWIYLLVETVISFVSFSQLLEGLVDCCKSDDRKFTTRFSFVHLGFVGVHIWGFSLYFNLPSAVYASFLEVTPSLVHMIEVVVFYNLVTISLAALVVLVAACVKCCG